MSSSPHLAVTDMGRSVGVLGREVLRWVSLRPAGCLLAPEVVAAIDVTGLLLISKPRLLMTGNTAPLGAFLRACELFHPGHQGHLQIMGDYF